MTSSYDHDKEVRSWADQKTFGKDSLVFLAGDPLGRAARLLEDRGTKTVVLLPGAVSRQWVPQGVTTWAPEDGPLETFLRDILDTTGPDGAVWEVWPAFERFAPETALDWGHRFRDLFRTVQGTWLSQKRFGTKFWKNSIRNALGWERPIQLTPGTRPLVIAASGPSLDDGLAYLARNRRTIDLWALPSSFEALVRRGLAPDAGVSTDGGFYAREHLHRLRGNRMPVLAALGSAPDPVLESLNCLFFSQGMPVEQALMKAITPQFPEVPSQGTVAVTAIRLALEATSGPVFIAGLDLSFRDLRGHTSPHTVDRKLENLHHRLRPGESLWSERLFEQATVRKDGIRTSPSMVTYAGWFRTQARFSRTVYRIAPSVLKWSSMTEVSWKGAEELWTRTKGRSPGVWSTPEQWPDRAHRETAVAQTFDNMILRVKEATSGDPWVVEAARTAVPDALAEDFLARRRGQSGTQTKPALLAFLGSLKEELL